jgi:anti-anti-sigma regulatory factor
MDITTERPRDDVAIVGLAGELDASNFERVIDTARQLHDAGAHHFVLDLSGLTYMGSSGLVAIHSAAMIARGQEPPSPDDGWDAIHRMSHEVASGTSDGSLRIVGPTASVDRVLERTGMKRLFEVHPDQAAALAAIHGD